MSPEIDLLEEIDSLGCFCPEISRLLLPLSVGSNFIDEMEILKMRRYFAIVSLCCVIHLIIWVLLLNLVLLSTVLMDFCKTFSTNLMGLQRHLLEKF